MKQALATSGPRSRRHRLLIPALVLAAGLAFNEALQLRLVGDDPIQELNQLAVRQPWGGLAARELSSRLQQDWRQDPARRLDSLDWALSRYPLDAEAWLLRAFLLREINGLDQRTRQSVDAALQIQLDLSELSWRALELAEDFADPEFVAYVLRRSTESRVANVAKALSAGARWFPDPEEQLNRILPDSERHLVQAFHHARRQDLPELTEAIWQRLEQPRRADDVLLRFYLQIQRAHGQTERVTAVRRSLDPTYQQGALPGGDFSVCLDTLAHLGWNLRMPDGVRLVRDERDLPADLFAPHPLAPLPQASLRLEFSGTENVRLDTPRVQFQPDQAGTWRLIGWWKAEGLTTRALPVLDVRLERTGIRQTLELPGRSFDWQPFALELKIDEPLPVIRISVARAAADAFDRDIGGALSLAGLRLDRVDDGDQQAIP